MPLCVYQTLNIQHYLNLFHRSTWGLACIFAYRAYNQSSMLELAKAVWDQSSQYVISASQAANGSHPSKSSHFSGTCNGCEWLLTLWDILTDFPALKASVEGGVFYVGSRFGFPSLER